MLGRKYRFHIVNNTGVTIEFGTDGANNTFTIKARGWKMSSAGALEYSGELTVFADPSSDLTDGNNAEGAVQANEGNLYMGLECIAALVTDAATDGTLDIYYEHATDDSGTVFPSDAPDFDPDEDLIHVGSIMLGTTTEDRTINFSVE